MPRARGNQPPSTGSNYNQSKYALSKRPKKNKKVPFHRPPKKAAHKNRIIDNKQSKMINKLSKQMYSLQMAAYGSVQQNFHSLNRPLIPTAAFPCCVDLTDFTSVRRVAGNIVSDGCRVYQATLTPPQYSAVSAWEPSAAAVNLYWNNQNQDAPDTGKYLAMNCTYFVDVEGISSLDNTRVRFDVISQRPNANIPRPTAAGGPEVPRILPFTLEHMTNLAEPHLNRINPTYFKKYFTKTLYLNSSKTNASTKGTTSNIQRFSFTIRPNKVCEQKDTNPRVEGLPIVNPDTGVIGLQESVPLGNFGPLNVNPNQPLWLIVSTDDQTASGGSDRVQVKMSRRVVWRDHVGAANL